ncbi:MAG: SRPBCC domain-containing protein [Pseudomonadota bacterium]
MTDKPDFMMSTYIHCTQDALWDALVDPDHAIKYNFVAGSCERKGNQLIYHMHDGSLMLICTHTEETPKTKIDSTFEPHWAGPDVPLQASRFVYMIAPQADFCKLTLEHYDIPADMQDGVSDGWARTLSALKSYLETGKVVTFPNTDMMEG